MIYFDQRSAMELIALEHRAFGKTTRDEAINQLLSAVLSPSDLLVWRCGERPEWLEITIENVQHWLDEWPEMPAR